MHDVDQVLANRRPQALVETASFLQRAGGIVPSESKAVVAPHYELVEDTYRAPSSYPARREGVCGSRRIHLRIARIGNVQNLDDGNRRIGRNGRGMQMPERSNAG